MVHVILTTSNQEKPIDDQHWFVTVGLNCWGRGETVKESFKNCQANAWASGRRNARYITRACPREGFGIDPVDGSVSWSEKHDAKSCPVCTVGKGIRIDVSTSAPK